MDETHEVPQRRFIAGAVCPGCGQMDKLKAWVSDEIQHRQCVACGFTDRMAMNSPQGIPTRVDPSDPNAAANPVADERPVQVDTVQPLKFHPRPPKSPKRD